MLRRWNTKVKGTKVTYFLRLFLSLHFVNKRVMKIGVQPTCINKFSTIRGNFYCIIPRFVEKNAWFSENFTIIFVAGFVIN